MAKVKQDRVIALQKMLKRAKDALSKIEHGCHDPRGVAIEASYDIMNMEMASKPNLTPSVSPKL